MKGVIAVDIGGTKIAAACYGECLTAMKKRETCPSRGPDGVMESVAELIRQTAAEGGVDEITACGVACPGPLSPSRGVVVSAPTLGWTDYPLREHLSGMLGCPVVLENDANAAALGEYLFGAGRGAASLAYVTISTGVGCGVVINGRIVEGAHEGAGELGHLHMVDGGESCVCGRKGCLEAYASGTGIAKMARKRALARGMAPEEVEHLDAKRVADLARAGDPDCLAVYREAGAYLGKAFAALQMTLDLERIILGGSVTRQMDLLAPSLRESLAAYSYWGRDADALIRMAELGEGAGMMGAGALAREQWGNR